MIVTILSIVVAVLIAAAFCAGLITGVATAAIVAYFYRHSIPRPQPMQPHFGLPPELVRRQKEIVQKVKGQFDGKLSTRQQEIMDQELEKVLIGKK